MADENQNPVPPSPQGNQGNPGNQGDQGNQKDASGGGGSVPPVTPVPTSIPSPSPAPKSISSPTPKGPVIPSRMPSQSKNMPTSPKPEQPEETKKTEEKKERVVPPTDAPYAEKKEAEVKEGPTKDLSAGRTVGAGILLKWFLIFGFVLLGIFYAVLLWGLLGGNVSNPLFETLGIQADDLQGLLFTMTNTLFGLLALFFLIGTLIKFFQWLILGKNAANRHQYGVKSTVFLGTFIAVCAIWVGLFWVITNADADTRRLKESMIITNPENVVGLSAPVTVEFDVTNQLFKKIDQELVRQISWDFEGDGEIDATGPKVMHRFVNKGEHNGRFPVTVNVDYYSPSLKMDKVFTTMREVIVSNVSVLAAIKAEPVTGPVPLEVVFSPEGSEDPDGQIVLYEWDLDGDGEYEQVKTDPVKVTKTYSQVGEYPAKLRVTGASSDTSEREQKIIVTESEDNLQAKITSDSTFEGLVPFDITLSADQSYTRFGDIVKYEWQIENEEEAVEGKKIQRTFREPGNYAVTLIIENDLGERHRVTKVVKALAQPREVKVNIHTSPPAERSGAVGGKAPFEVTFDPSSSTVYNPTEWRWDFDGNGTPDSYAQIAKYVFKKPGAYAVKLTIVDARGNEYEKTQNVVVERAGVQARISASPISGTVPLTVAFDGSASSTDRGEIVDYIWEFPNEEIIHSDANITYEFTSVGTFPVKLRVMTSEGESKETSTFVSVRSYPVKADFKILRDDENKFIFRFDPSLSTGTIVDYLWDFGDGNTSKKTSPIHTYKVDGEYEVSLKVTSSQGVVSRTKQKVIAGGE